ncbi:39100_t:CDS:1, partial [Gigaspora margarita]
MLVIGTDGFGSIIYRQVICGKESWNSKGMGCLINMRCLTLEKQVKMAKMENPFDNVYKNPNTIGVSKPNVIKKRKTKRSGKYVSDISLVNGEDPKDLD